MKNARIRRVFFSLMVALVAAVVMATPARADYQYKLRIFAGNRGSFGGADVVELGTFDYGDTYTLKSEDVASMVTIEDSKYYVKGFRVSGQDELNRSRTFTMTEDIDLVVAYGVEGAMVSYTIHYVDDTTGRELGQATYQGKEGDKPVESYEYFEGYRPLYRNITGTLGPDGTNDWTLPYVPVTVPETVVTETVTTTTTTTTTPTATTPATTTPATTTEGTAPATEGTTTEGGAAATTTPTPQTVTAPQTEEILDVDTPLAGPDGQGTEGQSGTETIESPNAPLAGVAESQIITGIIAAIMALLAFFLLRRKKDDKEKAKDEFLNK